MEKTAKLKSFFKGSIVLIISNVFLKAINFLLLPLYTKNLTPEMLGISDTITSFTGLVFPILVMGLDSAYSAFYFEEKKPDWPRKIFSTIFSVLIMMSLIPIIAIPWANRISGVMFGNEKNSIVIILALISVSLNLIYLPYTLEIRMQNRMTVYGIITVVVSFLMILLNILFVSILKLGVYALVLSTVIVYFIQLLLTMICSRQHFSMAYIDVQLLKRMLTFSLPIVPTVVATWVLNLSDRYIILHYWGENEVGLYGIGSRFVSLVNVVISAVSMAYTTFAYSNVSNPDAQKQYSIVLNVIYIPLIGVAFIVAFFSREIVGIMAANSYSEAYRPICDMMFAQVIYGISTITNYGIYFKKKSKYVFFSSLIAAIVNVILNILFIPQYGISAAAATTLISYLLMFSINYLLAQKLYPCDYGMKTIAISFILLYVIIRLFETSSLLIKIVTTIISAIITLWMFRNKIKEIIDSILIQR